jgi:putative transcriptional regulator
MSKFGEELIESMQQAAAHAGGRKVPGVRVTTVKIPDVKAIRKALHMSQYRFAASYRIPLPTLKNWEQGRRAPDAPAAAYLRAIQRRPKEVMEAVAG